MQQNKKCVPKGVRARTSIINGFWGNASPCTSPVTSPVYDYDTRYLLQCYFNILDNPLKINIPGPDSVGLYMKRHQW